MRSTTQRVAFLVLLPLVSSSSSPTHADVGDVATGQGFCLSQGIVMPLVQAQVQFAGRTVHHSRPENTGSTYKGWGEVEAALQEIPFESIYTAVENMPINLTFSQGEGISLRLLIRFGIVT